MLLLLAQVPGPWCMNSVPSPWFVLKQILNIMQLEREEPSDPLCCSSVLVFFFFWCLINTAVPNSLPERLSKMLAVIKREEAALVQCVGSDLQTVSPGRHSQHCTEMVVQQREA